MQRKKYFKSILVKIIAISVLLVLIMGSLSITTYAETATEKKKRLEKEIKAAKADQQQIKNEITKSVLAITDLEAQIAEKDLEIARLDSEIDDTQEEVDKISTDLKTQEAEYLKQEELVKQRIVFMYESGQNKTWEILLKSDGIMNFLSNYYMLQELSKIDNEILSESSRNKRKIEVLKKELDSKEKLLTESKERVEKSKIVQRNLMTLKEQNIDKLTKDEKTLLSKINKLEQDKKAAEREIARQMAAYVSMGRFVGGQFAWPVPSSTYITTIFGSVGPSYSGSSEYPWYTTHRGIDIGASHGAAVVASNAGVVALTRNVDLGGYGKYVMIDHGGGYFTFYAHGSKVVVSPGDKVSRGQKIMEIGNTGTSTGPHLHFELVVGSSTWDDDKRVNPIPYLVGRP